MSETTTDLLSYLKQTNGLTETTFHLLTVYGFDSSDTLMAMDVHKDLPQLTSITFGQRALLKHILGEYKTFDALDKNQISYSDDEDLACDGNRCQNKIIIDKIKEVLQQNGNQRIGQMKDNLKKYRQALIRTRHEMTKLKTNNTSQEIELKRLKGEIFRLRSRNTEKTCDKCLKLEENIEEKDIYIKKLEEKLSKQKRRNTEIVADFKDWHQNCFNDLERLKSYLSNESMALHRRDSSISEESAPINFIPEPPKLQPVIDENTAESEPNPELQKPSNFDIRPPELTPEVVTEKVRSEPPEEEVLNISDNNNNNNEKYFSLDESLTSVEETHDKSDSLSDTTSQVVRVSKEMAFQYLSPIECNETIDHNYSVISESSVVKPSDRGRPQKSAQKPRSNSFSGITLRNHSKRESSSKNTNNSKKLKPIDTNSEDMEEDNRSTHLVLFSTDQMESTAKEEERERLRRDSVILSSITGSKLISIDISGDTESDGNMTDTNSLTLQQNIISYDNVSQIATSNGYLSDSNEENRCSIVNAVAPITSSSMSTRSRTVQQHNGFKCSLPDCDFVTLFKTKFDDHINNHVTYHFGQEIPDFWRPYFEEYKKDLPQFKTN